MMPSATLPQRRVPLRQCVACGTHRPKRELVRIVRSPQGAVLVDRTGRATGRGAYLCALPPCWDQALKRGRLDHALRAHMGPEQREALQQFARGLARDGQGEGAVS